MSKIEVYSEICNNKMEIKEADFLLKVFQTVNKFIYQPAVSGIPAPSGLT